MRKGAWNHNTHYQRLVISSMPAGTTRALDVGCGEGDLLADLTPAVRDVVGIDIDGPILDRAASAAPTATLVHGDFLSYPFDPGSFDLVASIASIHHMDLATGLQRMAYVLRPGGVAVIVGLARPVSAKDWVFEAAGFGATRVMRLVLGYKEVKAPTVWPPPMTYAECRRVGTSALPGARYRRRVFFRYSLVWTKP